MFQDLLCHYHSLQVESIGIREAQPIVIGPAVYTNRIPCLTFPGDVIFFDCFIPHRSKANFSMNQRRNMYLTYNKKSEGDKRMNYYTRKEKEMPPDDRRSNDDFKDSPIHMAFYKT